jgi:hypothetical protein
MQIRTIIIRINHLGECLETIITSFAVTAVYCARGGLYADNQRSSIPADRDHDPVRCEDQARNRESGEKVIAGHSTATVFIGPLTPGRYAFTGEFHQATAKGIIVAQ